MTTKIARDYENDMAANDKFTEALIALENQDYELCISICEEIMAISKNIEQRLATILLTSLAGNGSAIEIKEFLDEAYNID